MWETVKEFSIFPYIKRKRGERQIMICKIYNDGSHYIALEPCHSKRKKPVNSVAKATELDMAFDEAFNNSMQGDLKLKEQKNFVREALGTKYGNVDSLLDDYIEKKFKAKIQAKKARVKRFERKALLNKWNYFVTFTYDDKKHTKETFEKSLKKCLSNLASRRGWVYMLQVEYGKKTGRKHYHAFMYIPDGQMVGKITKKRDYSERLFKSRYRYENDFFTKFGRNDFQPINNKNKREFRKAVDYIIKYMTKTDEKTMYSRGIPSEIIKDVSEDEIVCEMVDFMIKYVLFDDVFDTENVYVKRKWNDSDYYDLSEFEE